MNNQQIDKPNYDPSGGIFIHHIFDTIQGEGPFVGRPAVFVRLYGCNLQCPLCDTDYTSQKVPVGPATLLDSVLELSGPSKLVVFSGGEPMRQNIAPAVIMLLANGFDVQIETNGTLFVEGLPYNAITVVCSPKAGKINKQLLPYIKALKYVLHADSIDPEDGLPIYALNHSASPRVARPPSDFKGVTYVQPVDTAEDLDNERHLQATIHSSRRFGYTLCLQTHKMIGLE